MDVDDSLRRADVLDRGGYPYVIHPLMDGVPRVDPALLEAFAAWAAKQPALRDATVILAPEAMALPLAAAVSLRTGIPYLVVRKRPYGLPGEAAASCKTGYSEGRMYINGLQTDDRVCLLEDVISTGGTLDGLLTALAAIGAQVTGVVAFVDKGDQADALSRRHGLPIEVMRRVQVSPAGVEVA